MVTVSIKDEYAEVLTSSGDLEAAIDLVLQRYTIDYIVTKVAKLRKRDATYQNKYNLDYPTFARKIADNETFVKQVEANVNKVWEVDLADWEFCYKGIEDWTQKLRTILSA